MRQEMYREVLKVSQKSRKSLVNVRGISKDEDLLNNSYFQQEDTCLLYTSCRWQRSSLQDAMVYTDLE